MSDLKPPVNLKESIILSIRHVEHRRARVYLLVATATLISSVISLVFAIQSLVQSLYSSDFYSYATLIFSDPDAALRFWQDIALSLAESLPVLTIVASLAMTGVVLVSIRTMVLNTKSAPMPTFRS